MLEQSRPIQTTYPLVGRDVLSETATVLVGDVFKVARGNIHLPTTSKMADEVSASIGSIPCQANCSGNGECRDGSCYCMVISLE